MRWWWLALAMGCADQPVEVEEDVNALLIADPNAREWILEFDGVPTDEAVEDALEAEDLLPDDPEILEFRRDEYAILLADALAADPAVLVVQVYENLPMVHVRGPNASYKSKLLSLPGVIAVHPIKKYEMTDAESGPIVQAPLAISKGRTGAGTAVAVLDTGVNYTHADLGGCSSPGGNCPVAFAGDFTPSNDNALDSHGHGTNVAAIVRSVAPGTKILALDVFRPDNLAYNTDVIAAINWSISNRATYNIKAINMSLGGGYYTGQCANDSFATPINNARNAGIVVAVASGNNGWSNAVASPGCVPAAITVGATYDANVGGLNWGVCTDYSTWADKVTCFSNSAWMVDMVAPGALINGGGYSMGGTSQATPHVAGAAAVLGAQFPWETVATTEYRLIGRGPMVTDAKNNTSFRRLDLGAGLGLTGDSTPPTLTLSLNSGAAYTSSNVVSVALSPSDENGIEQMCVNTAAVCDAWEPPAWNFTFNVGSGDGNKIVYAWLKDPGGNISAMASDAILLDNSAPSGSISINNGATFTNNGQVNVSISASDVNGVSQICVHTSNSCDAWEANSSTVSVNLGGTSGEKTVYAWFKDGAGNVSAMVTDTIILDNTLPSGSIVVDSGNTYSQDRWVDVGISSTDNTGVTALCVNTTAACDVWENPASSISVDVGAGSGNRTLYAWFKDGAGNISPTATDGISVDDQAPWLVTVQAAAADGSLNLSWSAPQDDFSGVIGYRVGLGSSPVGCTTSQSQTGYSASIVPNVPTYWAVCAVDAAGNVSDPTTGVTTWDVDLTPPTGTISMPGNSSRPLVSVRLSAADNEGVTEMCLSETTNCTHWVPYRTRMTWKFQGTGSKALYATFRDLQGNPSAMVSANTHIGP